VDLKQSSRILTAELLKQGLRFVDLTTPLREARAAGVRTHGEIDTHLSPAGHAAVARELHESVLELLRATSTQGSHPG
jgi:lysophospholipase L1-like esterase